MSCKPICKLCPKLVISQAVTFVGGVVIVNLPAGSYLDCEKYCVVIAQAVPATATINSNVVFTIGAAATQYPLTKCDCSQATVCNIRSRTRYSVCVATSATGGTFKLLGKPCCAPTNKLLSLTGPAPVAVEAYR